MVRRIPGKAAVTAQGHGWMEPAGWCGKRERRPRICSCGRQTVGGGDPSNAFLKDHLLGAEKNERALMVEKNRSKRFAACSDVQ